MSNRVNEPLKYMYNFDALRDKGFIHYDPKKLEDKLIENWRMIRDLEPEELEKEFGVKNEVVE